jgi:hypothetical protein
MSVKLIIALCSYSLHYCSSHCRSLYTGSVHGSDGFVNLIQRARQHYYLSETRPTPCKTDCPIRLRFHNFFHESHKSPALRSVSANRYENTLGLANMPKQTATMIPLLCDLCPKKPRFSDVSHLLTHISSKSHLSNRFKLQIRSQGEPEARRLLADFDNWYTSNGLEDLLSERLSAKEQKKTTKRTRLPSVSVGNHKLTANLADEHYFKGSIRLTWMQAKADMKAEMKAEGALEQPLVVTPVYRPPIPRMHSWSTDSYAADFAARPTGSPWLLSSAYETPTMKRNIPNFSQTESPAPSSTQLA